MNVKEGTLNKRTLKERMRFPSDLSWFSNPQRRRVRRLVPPSGWSSNANYRQPDVMMEEEKKEEVKDNIDDLRNIFLNTIIAKFISSSIITIDWLFVDNKISN